MSDELAGLIAKRFVQRRDAYAVQFSNGEGYQPKTDTDGKRLPFKMPALRDHLAGSETVGHYLLDDTSHCKLFAFDIDLIEHGWYSPAVDPWDGCTDEEYAAATLPIEFEPRKAWQDRSHASRTFVKTQMRMLSGMLARSIKQELDLPIAVAYSGAKGLHVYGFTGSVPAADAREAAMICMDALQCFEVVKGRNFFRHINQEPVMGYPNFSVEVFPKQDSLDGKDLGNLLRLPLGVNRKAPKSPTFFVDMNAPMNVLQPTDPVKALESGDPWDM